jgi:putative SOS response-associated peptidase YedK
MCGRYTLSQAERLAAIYAKRDMDFPPRYNVSPTQQMPIVLADSPDTLSAARWGLLPFWAKDAKSAFSMINAKAETVDTLRSYKGPFEKRRCLVPADGFYEWKPISPKAKQPFRFTLKSGDIFYFAGLWENSKDKDGNPMRTFTIITGPPNELVQPVHNRMPVILPVESHAAWLAKETPLPALKEMLKPFPESLMTAAMVSSRVGSPRNEDPSLIEPIAAPSASDASNEGAPLDSL